MWKTIFAVAAVVVVAIPIAGFFIAAASIGQAIAANWDRATTASLVAGLVATCGGGLVVVALLVSLIVGVPLATRFFFEAGVARRAFDAPSYYPPTIDGRALPAGRQWQEERPPQLVDRQSGSWQSTGPGAYRLWEEDPVEGDDIPTTVNGKPW